MILSLTLVDGDRSMPLVPRAGVALQELDVGFPEVREVAEPRPGDDGTRDTTSRHGAAAVSVTVRVLRDTRAFLDELTLYCRPKCRPWLLVEDSEWAAPRQVQLRADQLSRPIQTGKGLTRDVQAQWKAPDGVWQATADTQRVINADIPSTTGLRFTSSGMTMGQTGMVLPAASGAGAAAITLDAGVDLHWVARLYGPANGPELTLDSTGETLRFTTDLAIAAGDYLELNSRDRTALYLSQSDASRLGFLDFTASTWWQLQAGVTNRVRYHPASGGDGRTKAELTWRPAWL